MDSKLEPLRSSCQTSNALTGLVQGIITFLAETVKPEKVFLLNHPAVDGVGTESYVDLLVVVPCRSHILFAEHQGLVEFTNLRSRQVTCSLHRSDFVRSALGQGHVYYSLACTPERLVYADSSGPFPLAPLHVMQQLGEKAREVFEANRSKALAFYGCALACDNAPVTAFLLHQAAEMCYRAMLLSLMEKEAHTHSIKTLIKFSRRCAPQLSSVFPRDTQEEKKLVHQLDEAYLKGRYDPEYRLDPAVLELLAERVGELLALARLVFEEKLRVLTTYTT